MDPVPRPFFILALASLALSLSPIPTTNSSLAPVFVHNSNGFILAFAATLNTVTAQIAFHLSTTTTPSWIAAGPGTQMSDSLMFIAYPSAGSMVVSPRTAPSEVEPSYLSSVTCLAQSSSEAPSSGYEVDVLCGNLSSWSGWNALSQESSTTSFIWAMGPDVGANGFPNQGLGAGIQRHQYYGTLNMDLSGQPQELGVPEPNGGNGGYAMRRASVNEGDGDGFKKDRDWGMVIHGICMGLVWIGILPAGTMMLRVVSNVAVRIHWIFQAVGFLLFVVGLAAGVNVALEYNATRSFTTAHQILGILVALMLIVQLAFGLFNHRVYKHQRRVTWMGHVHQFLGPLTLLLGLVVGLLGFDLTRDFKLAELMTIVAFVFGTLLLTVGKVLYRRKEVKAKRDGKPATGNELSAYAHFRVGQSEQPPEDVPLANRYGNSLQPQSRYGESTASLVRSY